MARKINYQLDTRNIWFPAQVEPDPNDKVAFKKYWQREKERIRNGFHLADGQVYISGWLYWHTVYWVIELDITQPDGRSFKRKGTPIFRDLEWEIATDLVRAEKEQKIYVLVGSRGFGKSNICASVTGHIYNFFRDTESVISGGFANDIKLLADKIDLGLSNCHPVFHQQRLLNNWKYEVRAGWKDSETGLSRGSNSRISVRNYEEGVNTMAANGTRPKVHIIDEIGKIPNLANCVKDTEPCWMNDDGMFSIPILAGCVCAGTRVWAADGRVLNIEDLRQEDGIVGYNGSSIIQQDISWMKPVAQKHCYRITTTGGNIIECSEDHPLLSSNRATRSSFGALRNVNRYSFRRTDLIEIGDYLAVANEVPIFGNVAMEHARLLGLMLGDGYFRGSSLSVDNDVVRQFITSSYNTSIRKEFITKEGTQYTDFYLKGIKNIIKNSGLRNLTKQSKRLPSNIATYNKKSLAELLAGLFDADGNVYYSKRKGTRVVLTNISMELLKGVKDQLTKFGIHSSIYKGNRNVTPTEEYSGQLPYIYRLYISKDRDVQKFIDSIPIIHSKKVNTLKGFKLGNRDMCSHLGVYNTGIEKFMPHCSTLSGFRFETVTAVEDIGIRDIFNLTADGSHTYLANGFITHNTGGDMEKGADAAKIFRNPVVYNVLEFDDEWEGTGRIGKFVPVTRALNKYKYFKSFAEHLGIDHPDLQHIMIKVSNEQQVIDEYVSPRRAKAMKSTTSNEIIKEKAYYPMVPSESFLTISANDFPVDACQKHKQWLANRDMKPLRVELFVDLDGKVMHKYTDKMPVTDFPVKADTDKEGVIEIVEHPVNDAPYGLYVAGIDPYKQSESDYSDSLGSVYIFKRMTDNMLETFQYMPVAWYAGRPKSIHTWYETVRNLLKWYNAVGMCENADYGFIQYMIEKNDTMLLAEGQSFLKEISPTSKHRSTYGLPPTPALITHWINTAVIYTKEEVDKERDDKGNVTRTSLGVTRILDPMLLQEMTKFNKLQGNFDRVRSFGIALAYAKQLDALVPKVKISNQKVEEMKIVKSPFSMNRLPGKQGAPRSPFISR